MKRLLYFPILLILQQSAYAQTTCATAQSFNINGSCLAGSITDATVTTDSYNCGGTIVREYWLTFTLNSSSTINITASASNRNLALQLLSGSCAALTQVACANAITTANSAQTESLTNQSLAGGTYYIKVLNVGDNNNMTITSLCLTSVPNCGDALQICSDVTFNGNSSGFATQDLNAGNRGCLADNEHQSSWFFFTPSASGTLSMEIQTTVDYDFAIWQTGNCSSLGSPVRCSFAATTGNTGMAATYYGQTSALGCGFLGLSPCYGNIPVNDQSEGSTGDKWVTPLNITAGQTYIMVIDNYTADGTSYTIDFTLSGGAALNCSPIALPVEISSFTGQYLDSYNLLSWTVESELNNDHYTVERSRDGTNWTLVEQVFSTEDSYVHKEYSIHDNAFHHGVINYYRLLQTDKDGSTTIYMTTISIDNRMDYKAIERVVNLLGQPVDIQTSGIVIIRYTDGSIERRFNP